MADHNDGIVPDISAALGNRSLCAPEPVPNQRCNGCSETVAPSPYAGILLDAARMFLANHVGDLNATDDDLPWIEARRITNGDDDPFVATYDVGRLTSTPRLRRARLSEKKVPVDRNLVTVDEFATAIELSPSSIFELLKHELPSIKSPYLGRRVLRAEAEAWLIAGGASRSRKAKALARAKRRTPKGPPNGH